MAPMQEGFGTRAVYRWWEIPFFPPFASLAPPLSLDLAEVQRGKKARLI